MLYDHEQLMDRLEGDRDLVREVVGVYIREVQANLGRLEDAIRARHVDEIMRMAHGMKGSSRTVTAESMATLAEQLETAVKEQRSLGEQAALLSRLKAEFVLVRSILETKVA